MVTAPRRPRVVFLTDTVDGGGAERIAVAQAKSVNPEKFDKLLVVTRRCDLSTAQDLDQYGARIVALDRTSRWDLRAYKKLHKVLSAADIIHAHKEAGAIHALMWSGWPRRAKIVAQLHTKVTELGAGLGLLSRLVCRHADHVVFVSRLDYDEHIAAWHLAAHKASIVYNGVEIDCFRTIERSYARKQLRIPDDSIVVGAVGRIDHYKGYEFFLEAAARLRQVYDRHLLCVIAGRAPQEGDRLALQARAKSLGIEQQVVFLGYRHDINVVLAAMDVFVLSSILECLPVALLEAMAARLPVVATAVGGIPEVVVDGVSGLLVPAKDAGALASAVHRIVTSPDVARQLGQAAQQRVQSMFSVSAMARQIEHLYQALL